MGRYVCPQLISSNRVKCALQYEIPLKFYFLFFLRRRFRSFLYLCLFIFFLRFFFTLSAQIFSLSSSSFDRESSRVSRSECSRFVGFSSKCDRMSYSSRSCGKLSGTPRFREISAPWTKCGGLWDFLSRSRMPCCWGFNDCSSHGSNKGCESAGLCPWAWREEKGLIM